MWKGSISFVFELLLAEALFGIFMPKRSLPLLRYILCLLCCFSAAYFIPSGSNRFLFLLFLLFLAVLTFATQIITLKTSVWNCIYIGVIGYLTQHLMQQVKNFAMLLYPYIGGTLERVDFERILVSICVAIVYTAIYFLFARKMKTRQCDMTGEKKRIVVIAGLVLFFSVALSVFTASSSDLNNYVIEKGYATVCCILSFYLLMGLQKEGELKSELEIVKRIQNEKKEHYTIAKETIDIINTKCHDFKHQIRSIRQSGGTDDEFLKELENNIGIYDSMLKTGNDPLDVILTEKSLLCEKKGVTFSCIIDGEKMSFMKDFDIYSLFGNALDNALEAVIALPDPADRRIAFKIFSKNNFVAVHLQNKYDSEISFNGDLPVTSKQDKSAHGFGMMSIRMIVEKYNGTLIVTTDKGIFNLDMLFPLHDSSKKELKRRI